MDMGIVDERAKSEHAQIVSACAAARAELERLVREIGDLPPEVMRALGHLNRYLFNHDREQMLKNFAEISHWLDAPYQPVRTQQEDQP